MGKLESIQGRKGLAMPGVCTVSSSPIALHGDSSRRERGRQLCVCVPLAGRAAMRHGFQISGVLESSTSHRRLIKLVAQTVPSDPSAGVPSYGAASLGKPEEVRMTVGARLAKAFVRHSASDEDAALQIKSLACSLSGDKVVAKSYATGRAETLERICDASYNGGGGGLATSVFQINAGGSGGAVASDNGSSLS